MSESAEKRLLSDSEIFQLRWKVRAGEASIADARKLLTELCDCVDEGRTISNELLSYLRDAFREYLEEEQKIETALGLVRRTSGRPPSEAKDRAHQREIDMAFELLKRRVAGDTEKEACWYVDDKFHNSKRAIQSIWKKHKAIAFDLLKIERENKTPFSDAEKSRLKKIYAAPAAKLDKIRRGEK